MEATTVFLRVSVVEDVGFESEVPGGRLEPDQVQPVAPSEREQPELKPRAELEQLGATVVVSQVESQDHETLVVA